ncbi:MAG TPA: pantoate--beta-alanine ligase [Chitinophagaceae bacterium]
MIVHRTSEALKTAIESARQLGHTVGFVPTMGALHQGHISLMETAKLHSGYTVCSIFINPMQFNDQNDFNKYPVTTESDITMLEKSQADTLFLPLVSEVYPDGTNQLEHYDLGYLETIFEGKYRPGHFQGVSQVMSRLLKIVQPDHLFMGQKDYQQCMVVKKLLELIGMHEKVRLHVCPTVREAGGLAMSSRNLRLSAEGRERAGIISTALEFTKEHLQPGDLSGQMAKGRQMLTDKNIEVDYFEIADADTLLPVSDWNGKQRLVTVVAGFVDGVRLIDNMILNP